MLREVWGWVEGLEHRFAVGQTMKHIAITIDLKFAFPWHQDCYQGIMRYAQRHGWRCSLDLYASGVGGDLSAVPYDGVIGRIPDEVAERVQRLGVPMSNLRTHIEANFESAYKQLPGVYVDRDAAIRMSIEHLAHEGYRRLGVLAMLADDQDHVVQVAHAVGKELGMALIEPFLFPGNFADTHEQHVSTLKALNEWVAKLPPQVGLMVIHPMLSRLVAHACIEQGRPVPQEVGIITPAGEQVQTLSGTPTISAVEFDHYKQGYEAAALLDKLMAGEAVAPLRKMLAPAGLVVRDSTDVFLCEDELVSRTMRYIAEHVRQELTVQGLAAAMGVGKRTLHRKFDEVLGRSVQHEVNRLRLDNLKRLLSETDLSITKISNDCGFSSPSHFSRYFKQHAGEAPSVYRQHKQERKRV